MSEALYAGLLLTGLAIIGVSLYLLYGIGVMLLWVGGWISLIAFSLMMDVEDEEP